MFMHLLVYIPTGLATYKATYPILDFLPIYPFIILHVYFDAFFLANHEDLPLHSPPSLGLP